MEAATPEPQQSPVVTAVTTLGEREFHRSRSITLGLLLLLKRRE